MSYALLEKYLFDVPASIHFVIFIWNILYTYGTYSMWLFQLDKKSGKIANYIDDLVREVYAQKRIY